jgi:uncharacterized phage protein (TIGR01671 family)
MREIKFRAWNIKNNKYDCFDFSTIQGYEGEICGVLLPSGENLNYNSGYGNDGINPNLEIEQFTGLHDKNGKEIYEGDIVQNEHGHISAIEYSEKEARFGTRVFIFDVNSLTIIGNIHETPELLK